MKIGARKQGGKGTKEELLKRQAISKDTEKPATKTWKLQGTAAQESSSEHFSDDLLLHNKVVSPRGPKIGTKMGTNKGTIFWMGLSVLGSVRSLRMRRPDVRVRRRNSILLRVVKVRYIYIFFTCFSSIPSTWPIFIHFQFSLRKMPKFQPFFNHFSTLLLSFSVICVSIFKSLNGLKICNHSHRLCIFSI